MIKRPGQRQSISAASAVNAKGGFWFAIYQGALNAELFIELLKKMMRGRTKLVHLVVDGLPAHKKANVREYIESTKGKLTMHILPGYAPDLNPDELVWSHVKRTGVARNPLRAGEKLKIRIDEQLRKLHLMHSLATVPALQGTRGGFVHVPDLQVLALPDLVRGLHLMLEVALSTRVDERFAAGAVS